MSLIFYIIISIFIFFLSKSTLKHLEYDDGYYNPSWKKFDFKRWHLILMIFISFIPIANIVIYLIVKCVFWFSSEFRSNSKSSNKIKQFLNKPIK